jgi:hypothetical protein
MRNSWLAVLAVVPAVALMGACGDDDDDGGEAVSAGKQEFIEKTNAACDKVYERTDKITSDFFDANPEPTPAEAAKFMARIAPLARDSVNDIKRYDGPKEDQAELNRIGAAAEDGVAEVEKAAKDEELASAILGGGKDPFARAKTLAKDYGLDICGRA